MADERRRGGLGRLILGGVVGAAMGMLVAPKTGSGLRANLSQRSAGWRARTGQVADTVRGRVDGIRENVKPTAASVRERVTPMVEQVTLRVRGRRDDDKANGASEPETVAAGDGARLEE